MKNTYLFAIAVLLMFAGIASCTTDPEAKNLRKLDGKDPQYLENLRAWKKTYRDRQISFCWYAQWTGQGASMKGSMRSVPDSIDIISVWGDPFNQTAEQKADMKYVQEVLGTKVVFCKIMNGVHSFTDAFPNTMESIPDLCRAIADSVYKYGYDGFDIDYESHNNTHLFYDGNTDNPSAANRYGRDNFEIFVKELGKYLGPKSGSGKLLIIDGYQYRINPDLFEYFDYFVCQAYYTTGENVNSANSLNGRWKKMADADTYGHSKTTQYLVTEDFERHWDDGGNASTVYLRNDKGELIDADGDVIDPQSITFTSNGSFTISSNPRLVPIYCRGLEAMARWHTIDGMKGGCGTYHAEYEYAHDPDYKYLRQAIQIMNPAKQ